MLRPKIPAVDSGIRVMPRTKSPPFPLAPSAGIASHPAESVLDEADLARVLDYFERRHAPATIRAYRADVTAFAQWCQSRGLPALPACAHTVAAFITAEAEAGRKVSTIRRRVTAIRLAHRYAACEAAIDFDLVQGVLSGIANTHGTAPDQKAPALAEQLRAMLDTVDLASRQGLRDRALLTLGFAGAFRRSELVALRVEDLDESAAGMHVFVRRSKTDQAGAGAKVPVLRGEHYCPVHAVREWLSAASITQGFIFRRLHRGGGVSDKPLTGQSVAKIVKRYAAAAGLDSAQFAAHSLRSGFLTSAAMSGSTLIKMMEVSRHKDPRTVMVYIRRKSDWEDHAGEGLL